MKLSQSKEIYISKAGGNMAKFNKDYLYELFQRPSRESFREYFQNSTGEMNEIDFKAQLEVDSKLAKHILGIANYGGGAIVFGVRQESDGSLAYDGISNITDKADITKKLNTFLPSNLIYDVHEIIFESSEYEKLKNKRFQILIIENNPNELPFFAKKDGEDIKKDDIYYRHGTNTIKADSDQIKKILARVIRAQTSDSDLNLGEHFEQLKLLYTLINKDKRILISHDDGITTLVAKFGQVMQQMYGKREYETVPNEFYPAESFEEFVSNCIQSKKKKIKAVLEIL